MKNSSCLPMITVVVSAALWRVSVSDRVLLSGQKYPKTARGHPWHPVVFRRMLACAPAWRQPFGSCGTVPDLSLPTSPAGPRTAKETDLLVVAAESDCSSWCGGGLWLSASGVPHSTARLCCTSSATVVDKFRCLAWRGPAGELTEDGLWWENPLAKTSSPSDATHEPAPKREVRNQRGFGGVLVTLPPRAK